MKNRIYLLLLMMPSVVFAQPSPEEDARHRGNKKNQTGFSFWFNSTPSKQIKIFDRHLIFDSDVALQVAIQKTKQLQHQFRQELRLVDIQMDYLVKEMDTLLEQQHNGVNNSTQILDNYTKLHQLNVQHYEMLQAHTAEIQRIFDDSYTTYSETINQKIESSKDNPSIIVVDLLDRYRDFKKNQ